MQTSATATAELNNLENKWRKFNANYASIIKFYLGTSVETKFLDKLILKENEYKCYRSAGASKPSPYFILNGLCGFPKFMSQCFNQ